MNTKRKKGKNYLSLDGGPSALSALAIVEEMSGRLQSDLDSEEEPLPCRIFDVITGAGNGGLGAILLGRMERSPSQAIEAYSKLTPALSVEPAKDDEERQRNTAQFETAFTEVLNDAGFKPDALMLDPNAPKTVVYATNIVNLTVPYPIRSYRSRGAPAPPITILQAACACVASQDRFVPVVVGKDHRKLELADATIACCNPAKELLHEALQVCGEESDVSTVLSIGAGITPVSSSDIKAGVSPSWSRGFGSCEQVHEDLQRRLHSTGIYFRLNVEKELAGLSDVILGHTSVYLQEHVTSSKLNEAIKSLHRRPEGVKLKDINSLAVVEVTLKPRPSLVPDFIGREDVLEAMHQTHFIERSSQHHTPPITVLSGLGGSGKTQIALRFALDFEEKYTNIPVYFLDARSEEKLKTGLETVVRSLGVEHRSSTYEDALIHLAVKLKKWLIIMDNADDPSLSLFQFIPRSAHGNVVITTRNSTHSALAPNGAHHIEGLSRAESITLLLNASGCKNTEVNQALAGPIVDELGCLPLALAHAGAYIRIQKCLSTYLDMYRHRKEEFLRSEHPELPHDYNISVAMTIWMSLSRLTRRARDLITLFSRLDVTSIAYEIIEKAAERRFRQVVGTDESEMRPGTLEHADALMKVFCSPSGQWIASDFDKLVVELLHYSLLRLTTQDNSKFYSMHILVQSYLQAESRLVQHQHPSLLIIRLLGSSITEAENYEYLAFNYLVVPQIKTVRVEDVIEGGDHLGFGRVLEETGGIALSLAHREECVRLWKPFKGENDSDIVGAMSRLAASYSAVGRTQDALDMFEEVLKLRKRLLGPEHPHILSTMGNLAVSYKLVGRNQDALDLFEEILKLKKSLLGPEHPHTLTILANLAVTYSAVGRNQDALDLEEEVLKLRKRLLGPEHPDTLRAMGNLAVSYRVVGRNQDALDLEEEVLKVRKRLLGPEHPDTMLAMGNLAVSYAAVGRNEDGLELKEEVLKLQKRLLGPEHPHTLRTMGNLAVSYSAVGRNQDGLDLEEEVLELQTRLQGPTHPDTIDSMWNLLISLQQLKMHSRMLELLPIAIPAHEEALGANHERVMRLKKLHRSLAMMHRISTIGRRLFTGLLDQLGIH